MMIKCFQAGRCEKMCLFGDESMIVEAGDG